MHTELDFAEFSLAKRVEELVVAKAELLPTGREAVLRRVQSNVDGRTGMLPCRGEGDNLVRSPVPRIGATGSMRGRSGRGRGSRGDYARWRGPCRLRELLRRALMRVQKLVVRVELLLRVGGDDGGARRAVRARLLAGLTALH